MKECTINICRRSCVALPLLGVTLRPSRAIFGYVSFGTFQSVVPLLALARPRERVGGCLPRTVWATVDIVYLASVERWSFACLYIDCKLQCFHRLLRIFRCPVFQIWNCVPFFTIGWLPLLATETLASMSLILPFHRGTTSRNSIMPIWSTAIVAVIC